MQSDFIILSITFVVIIAISVVGILLINRKRKLRLWMNIVFLLAFVLLASTSTVLIYLNIYMHATDEVKPYLESSALVQVREENRYFVFDNTSNQDKAVVFYGGAKVEEISYAPLLRKIAERAGRVEFVTGVIHVDHFGFVFPFRGA